MPQLRYLLGALLLLAAGACSDESLFDKSLKNLHNETPGRILKCTVLKVVSENPYKEQPVAGAMVRLYLKDPGSAQLPNPVLATVMSDSTGNAEINSIKEELYYVRVSHTGLENLDRKVKTPVRAVVNFETFIYP